MAAMTPTSSLGVMTPQEQLRHYRALAVALNEGPDGPNRLNAEALQRQLCPPRTQPKGNTGAFLAGTITSLLVMLGGLSVGSQLAQQGLRQEHSAARTPEPRPVPVAPAPTAESVPPIWHRPAAPDPATAMHSRVHTATLGGNFTALDAGIDDYRRLSGTLARMQTVALKNQSAAHRLPMVFLNRTNNCFDRPSIGVYSPSCEVIKIDYQDHHLVYEDSVEIEVVLAHEWGHHLIHISGIKMSPTEEEVVSDCMVGVVFGYYAKHGLITKNEALTAFRMIATVGNNSAQGHHPNQEVRLSALVGGLMSIATPHDPKAKNAIAFCSTLEQVLDLDKVQKMGLIWSA